MEEREKRQAVRDRIVAILGELGIWDGNKIHVGKLKTQADFHKFTDGRYKIYFGRASSVRDTVPTLVEFFGHQTKERSMAELRRVLEEVLIDGDLWYVGDGGRINVRNKYSIGWR